MKTTTKLLTITAALGFYFVGLSSVQAKHKKINKVESDCMWVLEAWPRNEIPLKVETADNVNVVKTLKCLIKTKIRVSKKMKRLENKVGYFWGYGDLLTYRLDIAIEHYAWFLLHRGSLKQGLEKTKSKCYKYKMDGEEKIACPASRKLRVMLVNLEKLANYILTLVQAVGVKKKLEREFFFYLKEVRKYKGKTKKLQSKLE